MGRSDALSRVWRMRRPVSDLLGMRLMGVTGIGGSGVGVSDGFDERRGESDPEGVDADHEVPPAAGKPADRGRVVCAVDHLVAG